MHQVMAFEGAVLTQNNRTIAHFSQTFAMRDRAKSVYERETNGSGISYATMETISFGKEICG